VLHPCDVGMPVKRMISTRSTLNVQKGINLASSAALLGAAFPNLHSLTLSGGKVSGLGPWESLKSHCPHLSHLSIEDITLAVPTTPAPPVVIDPHAAGTSGGSAPAVATTSEATTPAIASAAPGGQHSELPASSNSTPAAGRGEAEGPEGNESTESGLSDRRTAATTQEGRRQEQQEGKENEPPAAGKSDKQSAAHLPGREGEGGKAGSAGGVELGNNRGPKLPPPPGKKHTSTPKVATSATQTTASASAGVAAEPVGEPAGTNGESAADGVAIKKVTSAMLLNLLSVMGNMFASSQHPSWHELVVQGRSTAVPLFDKTLKQLCGLTRWGTHGPLLLMLMLML
jgi:hypothetical protein